MMAADSSVLAQAAAATGTSRISVQISSGLFLVRLESFRPRRLTVSSIPGVGPVEQFFERVVGIRRSCEARHQYSLRELWTVPLTPERRRLQFEHVVTILVGRMESALAGTA